MYDLRDYQVLPVKVGVDYFEGKSKKPSIIVAPTAFGKSLLVAYIAKKLGEGVLIVQPSKELLEQNYNKFTALGGEATIYSASFKKKEYGNVTYATIGSIKNLGAEFKDLGYKYLIIDEIHLFPRNTDSMLGKFMKDMGIKKVLGLTATPFKLQNNVDEFGQAYSKLVMLTSRSKKGAFFKEVLHVTQVSDMLSRGYWSKLLYEVYSFDTGKLVLDDKKAEYTDLSINEAYNDQEVGQKILDKLEELKDRKRILVFTPSVKEAERLSLFRPDSAYIHAEMNPKERDRVIKEFKAGKIRTIFNVNILSVGFDEPEVDCIIMGRPTASLAWFYQAAGRGTRIHPNKKDCLIVDFVGNTEKFGKIEELYFKFEFPIWKLYGSGGKLLTGIPIHEIGQHFDPDVVPPDMNANAVLEFGRFAGKHVSEVPKWYRDWMLRDYKFTNKTLHIKEALLIMNRNEMANFKEAVRLDVHDEEAETSSIRGSIKKPAFFVAPKKNTFR